MEKVFSRDYLFNFRCGLVEPTCERSEIDITCVWYLVFVPNRTIPDETGRLIQLDSPPEVYRISENPIPLKEAVRIIRSDEIYFRLWEECKRKFPDKNYRWKPEIVIMNDTELDSSFVQSADGIFRNVQAGACEEFTPGYNVQVEINNRVSELVSKLSRNDKPEQVEKSVWVTAMEWAEENCCDCDGKKSNALRENAIRNLSNDRRKQKGKEVVKQTGEKTSDGHDILTDKKGRRYYKVGYNTLYYEKNRLDSDKNELIQKH